MSGLDRRLKFDLGPKAFWLMDEAARGWFVTDAAGVFAGLAGKASRPIGFGFKSGPLPCPLQRSESSRFTRPRITAQARSLRGGRGCFFWRKETLR